ncbi:MAG: NAD-dependent epimerase/dehydratase family protein [Anaerolineae bacterium]|jgi:dihydroflavonol-4-reductase|nr:NAD-dependent epimerase/dehydratase family protein [Anaerolineae bacterium]MBT7782722.1 NAD-dependent epimerase/dehydratase family protein [Anaerolineae bacterium]
MTTYFITGGFGFLGQHIVKALHDHDPNAELRILGRTQRSTFLGIENLENLRWVQGDLSKLETFEAELRDVDVIVHNAAMVSFRKSDADAIYESNVVGTRNLAQAALKAGCKNFIFISSISAVGREKGKISDESMYPDLEYKRQHKMYGYSKMVSEAELIEMKEQTRIIILNPSVVLGPGSERIDTIFKVMRSLPIFPMLSYVNSFVDARDVAQSVVLALTKGRSGERYLVTAHNVNMIDFMKTVVKKMGKKTRVIQISNFWIKVFDRIVYFMQKLNLKTGIRPPSEMVADKAFSWEKIKDEMGWEPKYSLEESVKDTTV